MLDLHWIETGLLSGIALLDLGRTCGLDVTIQAERLVKALSTPSTSAFQYAMRFVSNGA